MEALAHTCKCYYSQRLISCIPTLNQIATHLTVCLRTLFPLTCRWHSGEDAIISAHIKMTFNLSKTLQHKSLVHMLKGLFWKRFSTIHLHVLKWWRSRSGKSTESSVLIQCLCMRGSKPSTLIACTFNYCVMKQGTTITSALYRHANIKACAQRGQLLGDTIHSPVRALTCSWNRENMSWKCSMAIPIR